MLKFFLNELKSVGTLLFQTFRGVFVSSKMLKEIETEVYDTRSSGLSCYAPINVKPQGRGAGYPREIDSVSFSLGGDFDIQVLPLGWEFDMATTCFGQKAVPSGGNLTLCPGVGNLTLALMKMSNSPGSAPPHTPWGLTLIGALLLK